MTQESGPASKTSADLRLYGIAIAAIPKTEPLGHVSLIVSPISVAQADPTQITLLEHLQFKATIDLAEPASVRATLVRVTKTLNAVVELQKQSFSSHHLPYRPVALELGQDSRNPMPLDGEALFIQLFGRSVSQPKYHENLSVRAVNQMTGNHYVHPNEYTKRDQDRVAWWIKRQGPDYPKIIEDDIVKRDAEHTEILAKLVEQSDALRPVPADHDFVQACKSLPKLLNQCALQWGNFSGASNEYPTPNTRIIDLHARHITGDFDATTQLVKEAEHDGEETGKWISKQWKTKVFGIPVPADFKHNKDAQAARPDLTYRNEIPECHDAFRRGYQKTCDAPYNRNFKLPLDPQLPPFVDPCADMIRDQLEIANNARLPHLYQDQAGWRKQLSQAITRTATDLGTAVPGPVSTSHAARLNAAPFTGEGPSVSGDIHR